MTDMKIAEWYNYDAFVPEKFEPLMKWEESPRLGRNVKNFKLWRLEDQSETTLHDYLAQYPYTIVEFGSFT